VGSSQKRAGEFASASKRHWIGSKILSLISRGSTCGWRSICSLLSRNCSAREACDGLLLISSRTRRRAPNLTALDRLMLGMTTLFVSPHRIPKLSVSIRPATLFRFHKVGPSQISPAVLLFAPEAKAWHPSEQLIAAIVEMKHRNPKFGCVRIAQQIAYAFGIEIDKDVVRRVLAMRSRPKPDTESGRIEARSGLRMMPTVGIEVRRAQL
jgi:hypothetical protein